MSSALRYLAILSQFLAVISTSMWAHELRIQAVEQTWAHIPGVDVESERDLSKLALFICIEIDDYETEGYDTYLCDSAIGGFIE